MRAVRHLRFDGVTSPPPAGIDTFGMGSVQLRAPIELDAERGAEIVVASPTGSPQVEPGCAAAFCRELAEPDHELGQRLRLRYLPELRFHIDDSLDSYDRISELLDAPRHPGGKPDGDG